MTAPPSPDPALDVTDLRAIIDSSADCIKVLDLDARLLSMNAGGMQTMEITDFSVCQHLLWPTFWEDEARAQVERALDAARAGQTTTFEGPARTFAGTPRWWEVRVSPLRAADGAVTRLLASSRDITARKQAEQQLEAAQRQLRTHAQVLEGRVEQRERALDAFVRFTTQVASSTELQDIATAASDTIRDAVGAISGFYLVKGDRAYPVMFSSNTPPEVIAARRAGLALSTPLVASALSRRGTSFVGREDGQRQSVGYARALSVTAYHQGEQPYALFAAGTPRPEWTAQERGVIESVGRGLGLALDREMQTQQLQERTAGLDAFVAFSEASSATTDILALARQAVAVLETTLRVVSVTYYELDGRLWKARVWSQNSAPDVVAVLTAGISVDAPSYAEAVQTRQAVFVPGWSADSEGVARTEVFGAGAFYPCFVGESPRGLLAMETQRAGAWMPREEAVFNAVGRSLTLALERAAQTRELTAQRDALSVRTQELLLANEELDAFMYSASHDLRTPVRHVMSFAGLARTALVNSQPDKVSRNLDIIQQGAARMNGLIDGMLLLSRAGRHDLRSRMVALEPLILQAQDDAQLEFPGQVINVHFQTPGTVWGDVTLLQQVLTNLISNAVKYSAGRDVSDISVQVGETEAEWTITVQDNGVGFDPRYAGKLFGIFQRLHSQTAFPGIGVGLATVRRIVLKHGGRVFADSVVGAGATFGVTLPKPTA